jgi:hypothetical protein
MPTRFAKQLVQMVRGGVAIGMTRDMAMRLALRCARDSIPPVRLQVLLDLASNPNSRPADVRRRIAKPWSTVKRELEALHVLRLIECTEEEPSGDAERMVWRYAVAPALDLATLRSLARLVPSSPEK